MTDDSAEDPEDRPLAGYYASDWLWSDAMVDDVKTLLLFFDKMVMTLPDVLVERTVAGEPVLAQRLYELGVLINVEPSDWLDERTEREQIVAAVLRAERKGYFPPESDKVAHALLWEPPPMEMLSTTHFASHNNFATRRLLRRLLARRLIDAEIEDTTIGMRADVRQYVLMRLAAAFADRGAHLGLDLNLVDLGPGPASFQPTAGLPAQPLTPSLPWAMFQTIATDLRVLDVDLSRVPLDEVMDFRERHGPQYRAYLRKLRKFTRELAAHDNEPEWRELLSRRVEELRDESSDLRRLIASGFAKSAGVVVVSGAGVAWGIKEKEAVSAVLSALTAMLSLPLVTRSTATPFAYLFDIRRQFVNR